MDNNEKLTEDAVSLYAAMYGDDDNENASEAPQKPSTEVPERGIINLAAMSALVRRQQATIEEQGRRIKRLEQIVRQLDRRTTKTSNTLTDVQNELEGKIDRRDW